MTDNQRYCLRWNNYQTNMTSVFHQLLLDESFVDVTLACRDATLKAHKVVLSACSPYFQRLLLENPCQHPVIILPSDIFPRDLQTLLDFVYKGEVDVAHDQLQSLLKTADQLGVKGLCEEGGYRKSTAIYSGGNRNRKRSMLFRQRLRPKRLPGELARRSLYRVISRAGNHKNKKLKRTTNNDLSEDMALPQPPQMVTPPIEPPGESQPQEGTTAEESCTPITPPTAHTMHIQNNNNTIKEIGCSSPPQTLPIPLVKTEDSFQGAHFATRPMEPLGAGAVVTPMAQHYGLNNNNGMDQREEGYSSIPSHQDVSEDIPDDLTVTPELSGLISNSSSMPSPALGVSPECGNDGSLQRWGKGWTAEDMENALESLRTHRMSLTRASNTYGIPSTTLWQRAHRLGIQTPKKPDAPGRTWSESDLGRALGALRSGRLSANRASKEYGIPSSTLYKIARREGIRLAAPFNQAPTTWAQHDLTRALQAIRQGMSVQKASTEFGIPSGTLYGRCKREGIELQKSSCSPWSPATMKDALEAVRSGSMSINQAALHYQLPYSSLYGRVKRVKAEVLELMDAHHDFLDAFTC